MKRTCRAALRFVPVFLIVLSAFSVTAFSQDSSKDFPDDRTIADDPTCPAGNHNAVGPLGTFRPVGFQVAYGGGIFNIGTVCSDSTTFDPTSSASCTLAGGGCAAGEVCITQLRANACMTGQSEVTRLAKSICYSAKRQLYTVLKTDGTVFDCASIIDGSSADVTVHNTAAAGSCGFRFKKDANNTGLTGSGVHFSKKENCDFLGIFNSATAQTVSTDMLTLYHVQINPHGVTTGSLTFKLYTPASGLSPAATFTVPMTGSGNLSTFHNAIRDGFNGAGLGLVAVTSPNPTLDPTRFASSYNFSPLVEVTNAGVILTAVTVTSPESVDMLTDTSNFEVAQVPALNPWGVAALVATLLLSSLWFLRRREGLLKG